jgi:predicted phosphoadenosine phosphosulfate sulfurtransferase
MIKIKQYRDYDVLAAAKARIKLIFDNFERIYCAFSGGKDSTVTTHLVLDEAIKRNRKVGLMYVDFEAQYNDTIAHIRRIFSLYRDNIEPHWICVPMLLRNAVTNYEPQWITWDRDKEDLWIREKPIDAKREHDYPFYSQDSPMEFEEFVILFGEWFGQGKSTAAFIAIRADESLHRYCAVATYQKKGKTFQGHRWTARQGKYFNVYPIYDWKAEDIWTYHARFPDKPHNAIYDKMQMAGVPLNSQRLCQPYGDEQRKGLWLYHILEPETWGKLVARVNGANSGALYIQERGNMTGYGQIVKPDNHTWKSYTNLLLRTMPAKTRDHYIFRIGKWRHGWFKRGYKTIPDEAPRELEAKCWVPSWRRVCKTLLRNDYWCKGLGQTQPKSEAYEKFKELKRQKNELEGKASKPVPQIQRDLFA